jgi:hypothetical protein
MGEYLTFNKMITPVVIQIIFWVGAVVIVLFGLFGLFSGGFMGFIGGLLTIILGPIVLRVYCEIIIVFFRVLDALHEITANTKKG